MPNRKAKQRKKLKVIKRKEIAEWKAKKRRERKNEKKNELIKCEICIQSDVVVIEALEGSVR